MPHTVTDCYGEQLRVGDVVFTGDPTGEGEQDDAVVVGVRAGVAQPAVHVTRVGR